VNDSRLGIAMNTYSGVMRANSGLIAFLNDDDRWTPEFLAKCVPPLLTDANTMLVFSDHWWIDSDGQCLPKETEEISSFYGRSSLRAGQVAEPLKLFAANSIPLAMASVFRKSAVDWKLYSNRVEGAYDYFLSYCLLKSGGKIVYVAERLTEYRTHGRSASAEFNLANTRGAAYVNELVLHDSRFLSIREDVRAKCIGHENHLAKLSLRRLDVLSAARHFRKSLDYRFLAPPERKGQV
jgi:hypothetical protein